jgi:hypothetical protein
MREGAITNACLLVAFCASLFLILAIVLDWVNLRPNGYQRAGASAPLASKTSGEGSAIQPKDIAKPVVD